MQMLTIGLILSQLNIIHITRCYSLKIQFQSSPTLIAFQQVSTKLCSILFLLSWTEHLVPSHLHNFTHITTLQETINHKVLYLITHITCLYHLSSLFDQNIFLSVLFPNVVKLHYYAGVGKQNEDPRYWHPTVFQEILGEIIFFSWKFLLIINLTSNYNKKYHI
jgi:hypothetical protein